MARLAFFGLGAMGARMAAHLVRAGHEVTVWNRDPSKSSALVEMGARAAATPRAAADGAEFAISMVRDDEASRSVWLDPHTGALDALPTHALAVECSTLSISWVQALAVQARDRGRAMIDAQVVGSRPQADASQLVFLTGGDAADVERVTPLLRLVGSAVHHVGGHGAGAAVKLAVNALFGVQVAAVAEMIGLLADHRVDLARALDVIASLPVSSPASKVAGAAMLGGNFTPLFPVELVEKDFGYVLGGASASGAPVAAAARGVMRDAMSRGWGAENLTGVVCRAAVPIGQTRRAARRVCSPGQACPSRFQRAGPNLHRQTKTSNPCQPCKSNR